MSKTAILPLVSILAGAFTVISKKPVGEDTIDMIATIAVTAIGAVVSIWGVFKNHNKGVK